MPRPDRFPDPHPVPRQRRVVLTALDEQIYGKGSLDTTRLEVLLLARGFDLALPYTQEAGEEGATVYVQDIPEAGA